MQIKLTIAGANEQNGCSYPVDKIHREGSHLIHGLNWLRYNPPVIAPV